MHEMEQAGRGMTAAQALECAAFLAWKEEMVGVGGVQDNKGA